MERRDVAARQALLGRIRREFEEMPGLSLTHLQASKLFGISHEMSARILLGLSNQGFLRLTADGHYLLASTRRQR